MIKRFAGTLAPVLIAVLLATGFPFFCQAQTAYVSDMLVLTFRQGPGPQFPVITTLKSDTPLNILEEENGFLKVELASGEQGWVNKNFVVTDLPNSMVIEQLKKENKALEEKVDALMQTEARDQNSESDTDARQIVEAQYREAVDKLKKENTELAGQLELLKKQYAILKHASADIAKTIEENKRLKAEISRLSDIASRQQDSEPGIIYNTAMIKWFLTGVGVLLLGWIIGHSVSSRRKSSGSFLD